MKSALAKAAAEASAMREQLENQIRRQSPDSDSVSLVELGYPEVELLDENFTVEGGTCDESGAEAQHSQLARRPSSFSNSQRSKHKESTADRLDHDACKADSRPTSLPDSAMNSSLKEAAQRNKTKLQKGMRPTTIRS